MAYQTYWAFCDKSTKFGTHVDDYMTNKSGYGGILDLTFSNLYVRINVRNKLSFVVESTIDPSWLSNESSHCKEQYES